MRITITLHGAAAWRALPSLALDYARLSVNRVVTVRQAPPIPAADESMWRDLRDTLQSLLPEGEELPPVGEPVWPDLYLLHDYESRGGKVETIGGVRFLVGAKQVRRKGAKLRPTYSKGTCFKHAEQWRDAFLSRLGVAPPK